MKTARLATWAGLAWLVCLPACDEDAGTPCRQDYHCYSGSCTAGTCDSRLGKELVDALSGEDEPAPSEPLPRCSDLSAAQCTPSHCKLEPGCALQPSCLAELEVRLGCVACNPFNCEAPCIQVARCTARDP